jgi:nicotinate (nicotinamide) nucleotide adenylyltransferase
MAKCVLVLTGSFNPPTVAHINLLAMARNFIEDRGYRVVKGLLVPTHAGYSKPGLAQAEQRIEMCRLCSYWTKWIEVDPWDTQQAEWPNVVTTLAAIQSRFPDCRIFFVCGSDLVSRWSDPVWPPEEVMEIVTKYGVIVAERNIVSTEILKTVPVLQGKDDLIFCFETNPLTDVSSTLVRQLLEKGKQICGLLTPEVEKFVRENHIYDSCG